MKFKRKRDSTDAADWHYVNSFLAAAAAERAKRQNIPPPTFAPTDPSDFAANLEQAVGKVSYTLPLVKNVDDLYDQRTRSDVVDFIKKHLYMEIGDFTEMMKRKQLIENEWDAINALLESAGRSKRLNDPHYQLDVKKRDDFATNLDNAIGKPDFQSVECADIEGYADAIAFLEEYFSMTADHFRDLIGVVAQRNWKNDTTHKDWDRVYAYLADAHKQKVYDERRRALQAAREAKDKKDGKGGFESHALRRARRGPSDGRPLSPGPAQGYPQGRRLRFPARGRRPQIGRRDPRRVEPGLPRRRGRGTPQVGNGGARGPQGGVAQRLPDRGRDDRTRGRRSRGGGPPALEDLRPRGGRRQGRPPAPAGARLGDPIAIAGAGPGEADDHPDSRLRREFARRQGGRRRTRLG